MHYNTDMKNFIETYEWEKKIAFEKMEMLGLNWFIQTELVNNDIFDLKNVNSLDELSFLEKEQINAIMLALEIHKENLPLVKEYKASLSEEEMDVFYKETEENTVILSNEAPTSVEEKMYIQYGLYLYGINTENGGMRVRSIKYCICNTKEPKEFPKELCIAKRCVDYANYIMFDNLNQTVTSNLHLDKTIMKLIQQRMKELGWK